jgi:hypothetical protein
VGCCTGLKMLGAPLARLHLKEMLPALANSRGHEWHGAPKVPMTSGHAISMHNKVLLANALSEGACTCEGRVIVSWWELGFINMSCSVGRSYRKIQSR